MYQRIRASHQVDDGNRQSCRPTKFMIVSVSPDAFFAKGGKVYLSGVLSTPLVDNVKSASAAFVLYRLVVINVKFGLG